MPLLPQFAPPYLQEKDMSILNLMDNFYAEAITINQSYWGEADTDLRFYNGDQSMLWNNYFGNIPSYNQGRQFNFNRIRRVVDVTSGYQRRNRKSTIVVPIENGDQVTADQFSKVLLNIHNRENVLETISDSFHGALVTGMNWLRVYLDYSSDPISGDIKVDNCPTNYVIADPYWTKPDMSDCNAIWIRSFLPKKSCLLLYPEATETILGLEGNANGNGKDGKFQFATESYNYGLKNLLTFDEYYYRDFRWQRKVVDITTGEAMEWDSDDDAKLRHLLQSYPNLTVVENQIPTVNLAVVIQGKVIYHGRNPLGIDNYPVVPVFAYYHPETPYYPWQKQGMVRGLRDAQFLYNRRRIIELKILESQITSGYIVKENALVNPKDLYFSGDGKHIILKEEAQMVDIQRIEAPQIPPSMIQLSELLAKEIMEVSGVNEELLGSAVDDKAGILSMLRQGAGLTTLQGLFDNLDRSQKLLGRLMIDLIQANYKPGKIKKILEGQEPTAQFYNEAFGKYHAVVEEGLNTTTQRQMQFAQMLELRKVGIPISDADLLEASTFQNKQKIIENIQQTTQAQQQMAQQRAQIEMQEIQSRIDLAQARAQADQGLGIERISRVQENQALAEERRAKALHDQDSALLEKIKAIKELESIDIAHIEKLVKLAESLKENNIPAQNGSEVGIRGQTLPELKGQFY